MKVMDCPINGDISEQIEQAVRIPLILLGGKLQKSPRFQGPQAHLQKGLPLLFAAEIRFVGQQVIIAFGHESFVERSQLDGDIRKLVLLDPLLCAFDCPGIAVDGMNLSPDNVWLPQTRQSRNHIPDSELEDSSESSIRLIKARALWIWTTMTEDPGQRVGVKQLLAFAHGRLILQAFFFRKCCCSSCPGRRCLHQKRCA